MNLSRYASNFFFSSFLTYNSPKIVTRKGKVNMSNQTNATLIVKEGFGGVWRWEKYQEGNR